MRKVNSLQGRWQYVLFFSTALLIIATDQLTKTWIRSNLLIGESLFEVGFFRLTHVRNTGAAFGLFQGQSFPLTIVAIVGIAPYLSLARHSAREASQPVVAMSTSRACRRTSHHHGDPRDRGIRRCRFSPRQGFAVATLA